MSTSRHRSSDLRSVRKIRYRKWNWNSSTGTTYVTPSVDDPAWFYTNPNWYQTWSGPVSSIDDNPHPNFAKRRARGEIIMSDMFRSIVDHDANDYELVHGPVLNWGKIELDGQFGDLVATRTGRDVEFLEGSITSAKQQALVNAYSKMNSSPLCTGEFLRDFDKSLSMMRRPFSGSIDLIRKMTRYKFKRLGKTAASALRAASDAWLEYRYGWSPLIMDAQTIIDECHNQRESLTRRLVFRASKIVEGQKTIPSVTQLGGPPTLGVSGSVVSRITAACHAGVLAEVKPQTLSGNAMRVTGLRPRDLPGTFWECVPYSFVVDWFVGVGSWVEAVTPAPGVTPLASWVTTVKEAVVETAATLSYGPVNGYDTVQTWPVSDLYTYKYINRDTGVVLPPMPVRVINPVTRTQTVDALSLTAQQILTGLKGLRH